jgi:PE family
MHAASCRAVVQARLQLAFAKENPMTFVMTQPDMIAAAAGQLAAVGSDLTAHNAAAVASATAVVPAAADEVSALTAAQFVSHASMYEAVSAHAAAVHELFVSVLSAGADAYGTTESANAGSTI